MSAGGLRERVTIQTRSDVVGAGGVRTATWTSGDTVWARITPVRGNESVDRGAVRPVQTYLVMIRNRTITPGQRLLWGSLLLNINTVQNRDEKNKYITMEAVENVAQ